MADRVSKEQRSRNMSRIRSTGTQPEARLAALVSELFPDLKAEYHPKAVSGMPDVYIPVLSMAVFADGCFFHGCPKHGHIPEDNREYWETKIARNRQRDKATNRALRAVGIRPVRIWEHQLQRDLRQARRKLRRAALATAQAGGDGMPTGGITNG